MTVGRALVLNKCRCAADKRTPETNEWNERSRNLIVMRKATTKSLPRGVKRMPLNRLASRFVSRAAATDFSFVAIRWHYLLSRYKPFIRLSTPFISLVDYSFVGIYFVLFSDVLGVICTSSDIT